MRAEKDNAFVLFLELLRVKHTKSFSNQYFNEHPHKYNLFGLSNLLSDYGVKNVATHIKDKERDITLIETPFVAHFGGDFAVIQKVASNEVSFLWRGVRHLLPISKFIEAWSGIVLLVESSSISTEPEYKEHRKTEQLHVLKKVLFFLAIGFVLLATYMNRSFYTNTGISILLFLNLMGVFIGWLLLLKHLHIHSHYTDRICSLVWIVEKKTQIRATPTILVNGYQLPESYKIEDLQHFTEFNVDVK